MVGIDAKVVLGLAGKMGQVFVEDGTYQAFPLAPIGLKAGSLRALVSDPFGTGAAAHAQFSVLVNEIPSGPLWRPDGSRLWETYGEVLSDAELLEESQTPQQQKAYKKAFRLLYRDDGGLPAPSPKVVAYERYRDAYLAAAIEYNNRRGEASVAAADEAVKAAWEQDEPRLRTEVERANAAWSGPGRRAEVDEARRVLRDLGSDSPRVAWAGFRKLFDPDLPEIFFRTTTEGLSYLPTSYVPTDVADVAWPRITVTADELGVLAEQAPEQLRTRLGTSSDAGIEMVSFEYAFVTVSRPWFTPQVFASRSWRFRDPERFLSDGGTPPRGECTAYVTGLVLARNIRVRHGGGAPPTTDLGFLPSLTVMDKMQFRPLHRVEVVEQQAPLQMLVLDDPAAWRATAAAVAAEPVAESSPEAAAVTTVDTVRIAGLFPSLRSLDLATTIAPVADELAVDGTTETATAADEVYVLALQCRLLPRSPASAPRPRPGAAGKKRYTVVRGDTLGSIAKRFYDDPGKWRRIYEANVKVIGRDPDTIRAGQKLTIP